MFGFVCELIIINITPTGSFSSLVHKQSNKNNPFTLSIWFSVLCSLSVCLSGIIHLPFLLLIVCFFFIRHVKTLPRKKEKRKSQTIENTGQRAVHENDNKREEKVEIYKKKAKRRRQRTSKIHTYKKKGTR